MTNTVATLPLASTAPMLLVLMIAVIIVFSSSVILAAHYYRAARRMEGSARRGWAAIREISRIAAPDDAGRVMAVAALTNEERLQGSLGRETV